MRAFNDLKLLTKITIPLVLLIAVTVGIVMLARTSLGTLAETTQQIVDLTAARMNAALKLQAASRLVTIDEKNVILETEKERIAAQKEQLMADKSTTIQLADKLIGFANNEERRAKTTQIKEMILAYFAVVDRVVALGEANQDAAAIAISVNEGSEARAKVAKAISERVSSYERDLATANQDADDLAKRTVGTLIVVAAVGLSAAAALTFGIMIFMIGRPLTDMVNVMRRLSQGDLDIEVAGAERKDEIGLLAAALRVFKDNAVEARRLAAEQQREQEQKVQRAAQLDALTRSFEAKAGQLVNALGSAATEMEATAQVMSSNAEETNQQSMAVASAAEQASANVQTVASAAEELASSIVEIGRQVSKSSEIAAHAVEEARQTDATVRSLAAGAQKIGDIVTLIQNIAAQTNLLALNATIEAARAGDAGKGFAVVASEVKALAGQTSKATDDIASQIGAIQEATQRTVAAIDGIGTVIGQINHIGANIAAAVEQQGSATQEIARNVQQAAQGTGQVTANIVGVKEAATGTGAAAAQVLTAANDLSRQSETLASEVSAFLTSVKAA